MREVGLKRLLPDATPRQLARVEIADGFDDHPLLFW